MLLEWLKSIDLSLEGFVSGFKLDEREKLLASAPAGVVENVLKFENLTPTIGFTQITKALTGNLPTIEELEVVVHAFGDDDTPPALTDTQLGNETSRKLLSSVSFNGSKAYYTAFYDLAEAVGTHEEMGLFMDADPGIANDGVLWDHTLLAITKTGSQSLTIDYEDSLING